MSLEACPNCGNQNPLRLSYSKEEINGVVRTFVSCNYCPKREAISFPTVVVKSSPKKLVIGSKGVREIYGEDGRRPKKSRAEKIREMESRNDVKFVDTPETRKRDSISRMKNLSTAIVMAGYGDFGQAQAMRMKKAAIKFDRDLGYGKWQVVKDDGETIIQAERINNGG